MTTEMKHKLLNAVILGLAIDIILVSVALIVVNS